MFLIYFTFSDTFTRLPPEATDVLLVTSERALAARQSQAPFPAKHTKLQRTSVMLSFPTPNVRNVSRAEPHVHAGDSVNITLKRTAAKCQKYRKTSSLCFLFGFFSRNVYYISLHVITRCT